MIEYQKKRGDWIDSIPVFKETKTPERITIKFLEEAGEFTEAFAEYGRVFSILPPSLLIPYTKAIQEEAADVLSLLFDTANLLHFDLGEAYLHKLNKDKTRFPPHLMIPLPNETGQQAYLRRKRQLGERK